MEPVLSSAIYYPLAHYIGPDEQISLTEKNRQTQMVGLRDTIPEMVRESITRPLSTCGIQSQGRATWRPSTLEHYLPMRNPHPDPPGLQAQAVSGSQRRQYGSNRPYSPAPQFDGRCQAVDRATHTGSLSRFSKRQRPSLRLCGGAARTPPPGPTDHAELGHLRSSRTYAAGGTTPPHDRLSARPGPLTPGRSFVSCDRFAQSFVRCLVAGLAEVVAPPAGDSAVFVYSARVATAGADGDEPTTGCPLSGRSCFRPSMRRSRRLGSRRSADRRW